MMRDERSDDKPPYSRVFVVCDKNVRQDELRPLFEKYGSIESMHMPRDRNTGEAKGIAYIKYGKTSSAAAAIHHLHMKHMQSNNRPLKVIVANNTKTDEKNDNEEKYKRLFIKVGRDCTEKDIKAEFSKFGQVEHVHLQKNRDTNECRGFAYVNYNSFYEAAVAFEECDRKYKAVFATPKDELKRPRANFESDRFAPGDSFYRDSRHEMDFYRDNMREPSAINVRESVKTGNILPLVKTMAQDFDTVTVSCNQFAPCGPIERLFNIVPGVINIKYSPKSFDGAWTATVKYESKVAAAHAVATINNFEFPSGQILSVKPDNTLNTVADSLSQIVNSFKSSIESNGDLKQLAEAIAQASTLLQAATGGTNNCMESFCSVPLPPQKPRANPGATVAQRCFLVFKPYPPPMKVLNDIFSRFGDFIEVNIIPNKNYGFAKFASTKSAQEAMECLHNSTVCGNHMKVIEAEECKKKTQEKDGMEEDDCDMEVRKRARIIQSDDE